MFGSGSCVSEGFRVSGVKPSGSVTTGLVKLYFLPRKDNQSKPMHNFTYEKATNIQIPGCSLSPPVSMPSLHKVHILNQIVCIHLSVCSISESTRRIPTILGVFGGRGGSTTEVVELKFRLVLVKYIITILLDP
jgi:hypothetical protein